MKVYYSNPVYDAHFPKYPPTKFTIKVAYIQETCAPNGRGFRTQAADKAAAANQSPPSNITSPTHPHPPSLTRLLLTTRDAIKIIDSNRKGKRQAGKMSGGAVEARVFRKQLLSQIHMNFQRWPGRVRVQSTTITRTPKSCQESTYIVSQLWK
jgi:hypothetical protein